MNRKFVYVFTSVNGTTNVINYEATNSAVNDFLALFDIWGSHGQFKLSNDRNHQEVWFECSKEFYSLLKRKDVIKAFKRMGVVVVFEYPFDI